jgi:hypothetical protein
MAVADRTDQQQAGAHGFAVEVHRAGAALRDAAAEFRAGQPQDVAQYPEKRHIGRINGHLSALTIYCDFVGRHRVLPSHQEQTA